MKTVKDKYVLVGADFAGFPLKEVVIADLKARGWNVTDIGVKSANEDKPEMFHRIGLKVGEKKLSVNLNAHFFSVVLEQVSISQQANVRMFIPL